MRFQVKILSRGIEKIQRSGPGRKQQLREVADDGAGFLDGHAAQQEIAHPAEQERQLLRALPLPYTAIVKPWDPAISPLASREAVTTRLTVKCPPSLRT